MESQSHIVRAITESKQREEERTSGELVYKGQRLILRHLDGY